MQAVLSASVSDSEAHSEDAKHGCCTCIYIIMIGHCTAMNRKVSAQDFNLQEISFSKQDQQSKSKAEAPRLNEIAADICERHHLRHASAAPLETTQLLPLINDALLWLVPVLVGYLSFMHSMISQVPHGMKT